MSDLSFTAFKKRKNYNNRKMVLVFATNNPHKLKEIRSMLNDRFRILSLEETGCTEEIPEDQPTLQGNASRKAFYIYNQYGYNCFADDTGLEVEALDGAPGVVSARYAGPEKNANDNTRKLLENLSEINNRRARFRTVISLVIDGTETQFEGIVTGIILREKRGNKGFGYDPVFLPDGSKLSFAEMDLEIKNNISHRGIAFEKLVKFLSVKE
jgi:XTP/dITP diphosphohydrolase